MIDRNTRLLSQNMQGKANLEIITGSIRHIGVNSWNQTQKLLIRRKIVIPFIIGREDTWYPYNWVIVFRRRLLVCCLFVDSKKFCQRRLMVCCLDEVLGDGYWQ